MFFTGPQGAAGAGSFFLMNVGDIEAHFFTVAEIISDFIGQVADGDNDIFNAMIAENGQAVFKKGLAVYWNERLGYFISKGAHFDSGTAGQDDGLLGF